MCRVREEETASKARRKILWAMSEQGEAWQGYMLKLQKGPTLYTYGEKTLFSVCFESLGAEPPAKVC